jgi:hypothetical protein
MSAIGCRRSAIALVAVLAIALALLPAVPAEAKIESPAEFRFLEAINRERASAGVPALKPRSDIIEVARRWSEQMAKDQKLAHNPRYTKQICCWSRIAENVGTGSGVDQVMRAFMGSSKHRANILNKNYTQVGVGVKVDAKGRLWVTMNFRQHTSGVPANAVPVAGDWNGDGRVTPGWFYRGKWYLRNANTTGTSWRVFTYGKAGDRPVVGDWNRNGVTTVGVRRGDTFHLRNANSAGSANHSFRFGRSSDTPIAGDWNGDGRTTIGVHRGDAFYLRNRNSAGSHDRSLRFGRSGDVPVTGDWNGNGTTTIGVRRGDTFHLRNANSGGSASMSFRYGTSAQRPLTGDWNRDGRTTVGTVSGLYSWRLRNSNSAGSANLSFVYGG